MPKISAIIFDLDGVLVTTDEYHFKAWKKIADDLNIHFDQELNNQLRGISRMDSLNIILEAANLNLSESEKFMLAEEKNNLYVEYLQLLNESVIDPIIIDTLNKLRGQGIKLAIGSSSKNAKLILERVKLISYFDAISDGNNIKKSKPDPEVFLKAAEYIMEEPHKCLIIEDAVSGIEAGLTAGMKTIAIGHAATSQKADYKIKSIDEILEIINC